MYGVAPDLTSLPLADANQAVAKEGAVELRCKRCRSTLANAGSLLKHGTIKGREKPECSHHWLSQPMEWMRQEMEQGKLEGRLACPGQRCTVVVGRYAWQGLRCSCDQWVVPGISLSTGKVDKIIARLKPTRVEKATGGREGLLSGKIDEGAGPAGSREESALEELSLTEH